MVEIFVLGRHEGWRGVEENVVDRDGGRCRMGLGDYKVAGRAQIGRGGFPAGVWRDAGR